MKRILVAPLDWGLGHATRCIPIIQTLLSRNCEVMIAGGGDSLVLLQAEFPTLRTFVLPSYCPEYPFNGSMVKKMIMQLPKFIRVIAQEHEEIGRLISKLNIDIVIADNRYGCWSTQVPSVFITHQSNILMPKRFGWLQGLVRYFNQRQMKKFTRCWIPDVAEGTLAGELISFGSIKNDIPVDFIGPLSRFKKSESTQKKYDVAAIFSGPEPQRTVMENIVVSQLQQSGLKYFIVRGVPSTDSDSDDEQVVNFMTTKDLQQLIESSELIIARSGYSTVMDMATLGAKAVFVSTPGQTEQEYLATKLRQQGIAYSIPQKDFSLKTALVESKKYSGFTAVEKNMSLLHKAIDKLLD